MSQENVEIVRRAYEAFNSEGLDAHLEHFHPDAEYDITAAIGPYAGMYYGRAAIRSFLADYFETWEYVRMEPEDVIEVGEDHVVVPLRIHMRGKESGVAVDARPTNVWTMSDGKALRIAVYNDKGEALRAVEQAEGDAHADT
jgi:ketosteroid isomerase-like protein